MYDIYKITNQNFLGFHKSPSSQNIEDYLHPWDTLKIRFIFVKRRQLICNDYMKPFPNFSFEINK